jgi:hypothetical protein
MPDAATFAWLLIGVVRAVRAVLALAERNV